MQSSSIWAQKPCETNGFWGVGSMLLLATTRGGLQLPSTYNFAQFTLLLEDDFQPETVNPPRQKQLTLHAYNSRLLTIFQRMGRGG